MAIYHWFMTVSNISVDYQETKIISSPSASINNGTFLSAFLVWLITETLWSVVVGLQLGGTIDDDDGVGRYAVWRK